MKQAPIDQPIKNESHKNIGDYYWLTATIVYAWSSTNLTEWLSHEEEDLLMHQVCYK